MTKPKLLFLFFCVFLFSDCKSQNLYSISDTAFVHFLRDSIPNCLINNHLAIDSARTYAHMININESGPNSSPLYHIHNIDGIQFFQSVQSISISSTTIDSFPHLVSDSLHYLSVSYSSVEFIYPLDSMPNLIGLGFYNDSNLINIPSLNHLHKLFNLDLSVTKAAFIPSFDSLSDLSFVDIYDMLQPIHQLPSLHNQKFLNSLQVYRSGLDSVPSLDSCRQLRELIIQYNNIKQLPDFNNNGELLDIVAENNELESMPSLSYCTNLQTLYLFSNKLDSLPYLGNNINLNTIYVDSNNLSFLPDMSNLLYLQLLHASVNKISALPIFYNGTMIDLDLSHNLLTQIPIPNSSTKVNWLLNDNLIRSLADSPLYYDSTAVIDISNNKLDFSSATIMKQIDEEVLYYIPNNAQGCCACCFQYNTYSPLDFVYTPQKPFGDTVSITVYTYNDTFLTIAYQQYADSYQWYHNGTAIAGAVDTILHIYCATQADAGSYTCHSIGQYFNTHAFRFNYGITEFESEPQAVIVNPTIGKINLAALYPAVSSGTLTLKYALPEAQDVTVKIYDLKGSLVYDLDLGSQAHSDYLQVLDLSGLASGSYIAQVQYSLGYRQAIRFVILH